MAFSHPPIRTFEAALEQRTKIVGSHSEDVVLCKIGFAVDFLRVSGFRIEYNDFNETILRASSKIGTDTQERRKTNFFDNAFEIVAFLSFVVPFVI